MGPLRRTVAPAYGPARRGLPGATLPAGGAGWWHLVRIAVAVLVVLGLPTLPAHAQSVVLHEFVPPDPKEDVSFATTTLDGDLPAAIQTPSGVATAPDPQRPPDQQKTYGGATLDDGPDSTFEPDRDTRRPRVESYDDPFSPATAPFKRLRAYDAVDLDYTLKVRDKALRPIAVGGVVAPGDEAFYGDLTVDLSPDQPVRVPTVGPGARLLRFHANPEVPVTFLRDDADNWFVRSPQRARVRIVEQLAIPRASFGSDFLDVEWSALEKYVGSQPSAHQASFLEVAQALGVSRAQRPQAVVARLVEYFRSFEPSDDPPRGGRDIYVDLALSKKGVCRHRAFAFLVTALNLGIPTRMVVNEAHAWVEVYDGSLWHRIDLGGAALNLDQQTDPTRPPYVPPPDPYGWPKSRDSGQDLVDRWRNDQQSRPSDPGGTEPGGTTPSPTGSGAATSPAPSATGSGAAADPNRPQAEITVAAIDKDIRRGLPLHLRGQIGSGGSPCAHVRVDVMLVGEVSSEGVVIGSLSTDDKGAYDGAVVVPRDFGVGEYELVVTTPGDAHCAPARSQ